MKQAHIYYAGRVQGVGFRFTVQRIVDHLSSLSGWVRNLSDGRVEIILEGSQEDIEACMKEIESHFEGYIRSKDLNYNPATGEYTEFQIKFTTV